ncbi:MAG TPA: type III-A CRISPR-associated RAMP protein Csm3 [Anaerolineae bacterium]|nr:type III-A CRISPR-associated RAMP protein Csm3 [Anaerolineae bacterium]HQK14886.1 type III-A CRISPR-associated RAMP protein Csm3 [Anaerolineae bacterium]
MAKQIQLQGRVFITFDIEAVTGLHIGGSDTGIEIGGVDKTVIRDPLTNYPYIPGSSLKGKMRSLLEKYHGLEQNQRIGQGYIHSCGADEKDKDKARSDYLGCDVCQVFGVPGERDFATPTRLVVRDTHLSAESVKKLEESGRTDLPYTEVKTEVSIDRVTSAANPRQMERVPAGTVFSGAELVYSIYAGDGCSAAQDVGRLQTVLEGLQLVEDDYLGGLGSRGSGKVRFKGIKIFVRTRGNYLEDARSDVKPLYEFATLGELLTHRAEVFAKIKQTLNV